MKKITKEVWETSDGRVFEKEADATAHEAHIESLMWFKIHYAPDLTEGRTSSQRKGVIVVNANGSHKQFAEHAAYKKLGSKVAFVQGVFGDNAIIQNWNVVQSTAEECSSLDIFAYVEERFTSNKIKGEGIHYDVEKGIVC